MAEKKTSGHKKKEYYNMNGKNQIDKKRGSTGPNEKILNRTYTKQATDKRVHITIYIRWPMVMFDA